MKCAHNQCKGDFQSCCFSLAQFYNHGNGKWFYSTWTNGFVLWQELWNQKYCSETIKITASIWCLQSSELITIRIESKLINIGTFQFKLWPFICNSVQLIESTTSLNHTKWSSQTALELKIQFIQETWHLWRSYKTLKMQQTKSFWWFLELHRNNIDSVEWWIIERCLPMGTFTGLNYHKMSVIRIKMRIFSPRMNNILQIIDVSAFINISWIYFEFVGSKWKWIYMFRLNSIV